MKPTGSKRLGSNNCAISTTVATSAWCSSACPACRSDWHATRSCTHALVFVHQFQPLSGREFENVVERQWVQLQLDSALDQGMDAAVVNAIARVTGGNFRLIQRLFAQIDR